MNKTTTYIYTLSHPLTGEVKYVGKTINPKYRLSCHLVDKSGTHKTNWIASLRKLGLKPSIDFIDSIDTDGWQNLEKFYISLFRSWGFKLTNGTIGGDGHSGRLASEETKEKMRRSSPKYWLGKTRSEEDRLKFSHSHKGKVLSTETRQKMSDSRAGEKHPLFGKPLSDEHKSKLWLRRDRVVSDEQRKILSLRTKEVWKKIKEAKCQIA